MKSLFSHFFLIGFLACGLVSGRAETPAPFTLVVVPDTQKYVENYPRGIASQTEWIRRNREALNCKFVIHEGDIVQNPDQEAEWKIADAAYRTLDGVLPYCFSMGNHDMVVDKREKALFRRTFPLSRFQKMPTFGGSENEHADNTFHLFEVGSLRFLVISLEFDPPESTLTWANEVVAAHEDRRVIVNTHSYLQDNTRNDIGKAIWTGFVEKHENIFLVLCGHEAVGRHAGVGQHGNLVHEVLANYQGHDNGGNGWLRILRFFPSENRLEVRTYSTLLDRYMDEDDPRWSHLGDNQFELPYVMSGSAVSWPVFERVRETAAPEEVYQEIEIAGWRVLMHPDVDDQGNGGLGERLREVLRERLEAIEGVLPRRAVDVLRGVTIWVEKDHPAHGHTLYHPEAEWLRERGMNPAKVGGLEIAHAETFLEEMGERPWMVLRELARAYHAHLGDHEKGQVAQAYEGAMSKGRYRDGDGAEGSLEAHEALSGAEAYFAEATETYFGRNDRYPFQREELGMHDPEVASWMPIWWRVGPLEARVKEVKKIWDRAEHNAFTDMVAWQGKLVCAFREGKKHAGDDGQLRVLLSNDGGGSWESGAVLRQEGADLRDARLACTPDDRLMLVGGFQVGSEEGRRTSTVVSFSRDGKGWTLPERIGEEGRWLWGVTWHEGRAYGVAYPTPEGTPHTSLMTSGDGRSFHTLVPSLVSEGRPTEAVVRFDRDGRPWCLHRRDGEPNAGLLGWAPRPEGPWEWKTLDRRIGGPGLMQLPTGEWIAVVRLYDGETRTEVCSLDFESGRVIPLVRLPSGGDTSYPGLVWHEGELLISYYSSHEGKTSIYFARVTFEPVAPAEGQPVEKL